MNQINKNINKSKTLSSKFYCDGNIFEEFKKVFEESLQPICSIGELSKITVYPFNIFKKFRLFFFPIRNGIQRIKLDTLSTKDIENPIEGVKFIF